MTNAPTESVSQSDARCCAQRIRELASLLPMWPHELADVSLDGRKRVVALLDRGLRAERRRGISGHWAYDLARHAALHRAWKRERADLRRLDAVARKISAPR